MNRDRDLRDAKGHLDYSMRWTVTGHNSLSAFGITPHFEINNMFYVFGV